MPKPKKVQLALLAAVALAVVSTFATLNSHGQNARKKTRVVALRPEGQEAQMAPEDTTLPVTDFNTPKSTNAKRKAKGARYRNRLPMAIDPEGNDMPSSSTAHWWAGLSPLPADKSDAVVVGEVRDAQAFLNDDNTGVYSEFAVKVVQTLKDDAASPLAGVVTGERVGGAVKFANGRTRAFRLNAMGFPRVGGRYVLFLQRNPDGQDYTILTGYELRGGHVFALDGNKKSRFGAFDGTDEAAFLNEVRAAIAQAPQTSRK
jgi:hypothetical protein